jgi:hypothetical protein
MSRSLLFCAACTIDDQQPAAASLDVQRPLKIQRQRKGYRRYRGEHLTTRPDMTIKMYITISAFTGRLNIVLGREKNRDAWKVFVLFASFSPLASSAADGGSWGENSSAKWSSI